MKGDHVPSGLTGWQWWWMSSRCVLGIKKCPFCRYRRAKRAYEKAKAELAAAGMALEAFEPEGI